MTFVTFVSILGAGVVVAEVHYGAGRHMGDIPVDDLPKGLMLNFMSQLVYLYGICFAKMAVGASLLRIASTKFWKHTIICFSKLSSHFSCTSCRTTFVLSCGRDSELRVHVADRIPPVIFVMVYTTAGFIVSQHTCGGFSP